MSSIYDPLDAFSQSMFWLTMLAVIVTAFGVHEWLRYHVFPDDDDDPDGYT